MTKSIRLGINGSNGRMGRALRELLRDDPRFVLAAEINASDDWKDAPPLDGVIDFSTPAGLSAVLEHCERRGIALVCGTTGLDAALQARLATAAKKVPLLYAANFSLGIAVMTKLLREAAQALPDWDLEILEAHHSRKLDAPSGTALSLGRAAAQARGQDFDQIAVFARHGHTGVRASGAIGFSSLRGGEIVGEHSALLIGNDERVELIHRASSNAIFARGALEAAAWLANRKPGNYTIDDVIAARD